MKKISKIALIKHKKEILELIKLGKQYDKETNPEKQESLKVEIIKRCNELKVKLGCSDEEAQDLLGISVDTCRSEDEAEKPPFSEADDTNIS